jgi:hypothetical protein
MPQGGAAVSGHETPDAVVQLEVGHVKTVGRRKQKNGGLQPPEVFFGQIKYHQTQKQKRRRISYPPPFFYCEMSEL